MKSLLLSLVATGVLAGCAGKVEYIRPVDIVMRSNHKLVDRPRDQVWSAAIPELGKRFFVINNLDKGSGFINLSYLGDPEKYIDCGTIRVDMDLAGAPITSIPAAAAFKGYALMTLGDVLMITRRMELDGKVNLIFEEISSNQTRVTANTRFTVKRNVETKHYGSGRVVYTDSNAIAFNTGDAATFPVAEYGANNGNKTECVSTGALELEVLGSIR